MESKTKQQREQSERLRAMGTRERPDTRSSLPAVPGRRVKDVFAIAVDRIRADADQVRQLAKTADDPETIELAASIKEHGLRQYPEVRYIEEDDCYEIVSGERRFIATTQILGWEEVPVRVTDVSDEQLMWVQLAENVHRKDLHPLDLAASIQKAKDDGLSLDQIAEKLKKSKTYVQKHLTISKDLSPEAQQALAGSNAASSLSIVYQVATVPYDQQESIAFEIAKKNLTRNEVEQLAGQAKQSKSAEQQSRGGRKAKSRPREETFRMEGGATVSVKFRRKNVSDEEILQVLQKAAEQMIARTGGKKAA